LRELEAENAGLKELLAEAELDADEGAPFMCTRACGLIGRSR